MIYIAFKEWSSSGLAGIILYFLSFLSVCLSVYPILSCPVLCCPVLCRPDKAGQNGLWRVGSGQGRAHALTGRTQNGRTGLSRVESGPCLVPLKAFKGFI